MNDSIMDYLSKEFKIDIINIKARDDIETLFLEGIVNELLAKNNDKPEISNPHSQAALAISNLRQKESNIIKKIEGNGNKEMFNNAAINYFSKDYSKNTHINEIIGIMNDETVKKIIFKPIKNDNNIKDRHHSDHWYSLNRNELNNSIDLYFDYQADTPFLSMEFKNENTPEYKPLSDIKDNVAAFNVKWPYPIKKELEFNYANHTRLGATMARYLPNIAWYKVNIWMGEMNAGIWTLILSTLNRKDIINKSLNKYTEFRKKGVKGIEYGLDAPIGEFTLTIDNKRNLDNPDIELKYVFENKIATLKIERASTYNNNSDSGIIIDEYAF